MMRRSAWTHGVGVTLMAFAVLSLGGCGQGAISEPIEDLAGLELVTFDIGGMT